MDKIKLLLIASNPDDTSQLKLEEEIHTVKEKIFRSAFDLVEAEANILIDLARLRRVTKMPKDATANHTSIAWLMMQQGAVEEVGGKA